MPEKLSGSTWTKFKKAQKLDLDDDALVKALKLFDATDEAQPGLRLDALSGLVDQFNQQVVRLVKQKKAVGDKFGTVKDKLNELLDVAEAEKKTCQAATIAAAVAADEQTDTPTLLTTKMVPLLRELRAGEAENLQMHALIGTAGKESAVLVMRQEVAGSRRKLLLTAMDVKGGARFIPASCLFEAGVLTFVVETSASGLAKGLRKALFDQTQMRLRVRVRGDDGSSDEDGEDGGADQAGVTAPAPPHPSARASEPPAEPPAEPRSEQQLEYERRLPGVETAVAEALQAQHPEASKLRALIAFAKGKAEAEPNNFAAALQGLGAIEGVLRAVVAPDKPEGPARSGPNLAGAYAKMKTRVLPQLDMAKTRNTEMADKIAQGIAFADALSARGDDPAAITRLRALVTEVEKALALDREALNQRMAALYDQATAIRLDLNPDPDTVRATVRGLLKLWDFDTARVTLNAFEKAIEKARPLDFENLDIIQKRRAEQFRKENGKAARNTEQAILAAKRVIDDQGNLLVGDALLDDPAYANPAPGSPEESRKQHAATAKLMRDLPFVRIDDLATVAEEIGNSEDGGLPQSVHALQMLQRLQTDKAAQAALASVKAPPDPATAADEETRQSLKMAQTLIRNSLGLAPDAPITDVDAKRAAMAALLSQVRQGSVGSCFATASAVRVQRNKPEQFLADMAEMLSTGKLKRDIESPPGTPLHIEVPISREMVDRKLDVRRKGSKLHTTANMVAGLDALGIPEDEHQAVVDAAARRLRAERAVAKALPKIETFLPPPATVAGLSQTILADLDQNPAKKFEVATKDALAGVLLSSENTPGGVKRSNRRKKLAGDIVKEFDDPNGSDDITPQELLAQIAKSRPTGALPAERVAAAKSAYDTNQDNTLMRAWEYTVASMAEQVPEVATKLKQMSKGLAGAAGKACKKMADDYIAEKGLSGNDAQIERNVASHVSTELQTQLESEMKLLYDPEVLSRSGAVSADGSSTKGGWSMFFRGKKIDGQAAFEDAIKTLADEVKTKFGPGTAKDWDAKYVGRAHKWADALKSRSETKEFRDDSIDAMATASGSDKDSFNQPWTIAKSGWEHAVMQLYENQPTRPPAAELGTYTYKEGGVDKSVTNAEGITHFVLDTLAKVVKRLPDGDAAQNAIVPMANLPHAFSLKPGNTSLATVLKQGKDPGEVVAELKELEGAKNAKRRALPIPLSDLSAGFAADSIAKAASIFGSTGRNNATLAIKAHFQSLGVQTLSLVQLKAEIKTAMRSVLDTSYTHIAEVDRAKYAESAAAGVAGRALERIIPKEEFEPLVDAAMRKLAVPDASRDAVKKAVLDGVKQDAVMREDLAKAIRAAMRNLGLGDGGQDLALSSKTYDSLKTDGERIAALQAAGRTVASPPATFDALDKDDAAALREHGVAARLDEKLDKALIEPRGLVFADTNWGDGDHVTNLSMVVNPLSDPPAIEMWQMNEDGSSAAPMTDEKWLKNWRVYDDPDSYGGAVGAHEVTTKDGKKMQWEAYRAELQAKFDDCAAANQGDIGKLRGILDIADARFGETDYAGADKALAKLAEQMAPVEKIAAKLAKSIKALERVTSEINKEVAERKKKAKEQKQKEPTPEMKQAFAAAEVVGGLVLTLRTGIKTAEDLTKFVTERKDVLDYIDAQSPLGPLKIVDSLMAA